MAFQKAHALLSSLAGTLKLSSAVGYYFVNRISQFVSILITILLVTTHFSPVLQGYYYTLLSLMSFQVLADFGLATVLMQFVSHEWAELRFVKGEVVGSEVAKGRLASLIRIAFVWMALTAAVVMVLLFLVGYYFIRTSYPHSDVQWQYPWLGSCIGVALGMAGAIMSSINMGCNQVAESQRAAAISTLVSNALSWIAILAGWGLYTLVVQRCLAGFIIIALLARDIWPAIKLLGMPKSPHHVVWHGDFWRQQWRLGISWLSGVGIYQSFVPIIFRFLGPVEAGRAGLVLQMYTFSNILAVSWLIAVQPQFGAFWARNDRQAIATLAREVLAKCIATAALLAAVVIGLVAAIKTFLPVYATRFGTLSQVVVLMISCIIIQILNVQTASVRFSKTEPFLILCVAHAAAVVILNLVLARFGVLYMYLGFLFVLVAMVTPWCDHIYRRNVGSGIADDIPWMRDVVQRKAQSLLRA